MKLPILACILAATATCAPVAPVAPVAPRPSVEPFDFSITCRVDYFHTGGPGGEVLALDAVVAEGPWAGSRTQMVDDSNLGDYFFEVHDSATQRVMYSRGFSSIYGEWITTPEFAKANRTFHESLRFPRPHASVRIVVKTRDAKNAFRELWAIGVDPCPSTPIRAATQAVPNIWPILESGLPQDKVDVLLMSEGYGSDFAKFHADAARLVSALFELEPFKNRKNDFNVRALDVPGRTLNVQNNVFGLERYVIAYDNLAFRKAAAVAPYDVAAILLNGDTYGGGGIFNLQSTVVAGAKGAEYVFVHELAHNLAGLGDEYVGNVTYITAKPETTEPWEPNLTALLDPSHLKWRQLVDPETPIPTPMAFAGKVGAFEGAGYKTKGLYRPEADCIMFSRNVVGFCRVCRRAIERLIDTYTH
jgi:hypothetical protein